jgi:Uma2 family endonuclease
MAAVIRLSEQEYRELALGGDRWELWDGVLVDKPILSMKAENVASYLGFMLADQVDRNVFRVNVNGGKTQFTARTYYMPAVVVIPAAYQRPFEHDPLALNAYADPLPFVAEVWSPVTEGYDVAAKLPVYRERGDEEIWFLHPFERTLTAWRRQPDGSYTETLYRGGIVPILSLPGVAINLDVLLRYR